MSDRCPKCGAEFRRTKPDGKRVYECMSYSLKRPYCETDVFFENLQCLRNQLTTANEVIAKLREVVQEVVDGGWVLSIESGDKCRETLAAAEAAKGEVK